MSFPTLLFTADAYLDWYIGYLTEETAVRLLRYLLKMADHVDEFWLQHVTEFDGKLLKSITRGAADLDEIKAEDTKTEEDKPAEADLSALIAAIKAELGEAIKDVRPSQRLTDSPVCLIADDGDMDVNLERLTNGL